MAGRRLVFLDEIFDYNIVEKQRRGKNVNRESRISL